MTWTLEQALPFLRELDPHLRTVGYSCALGGSVLHKEPEVERHDLDVIVFPTNSNNRDVDALRGVLVGLGWTLTAPEHKVKSIWRRKGSTDSKHVEVWRTPDRKRVDLFLLA